MGLWFQSDKDWLLWQLIVSIDLYMYWEKCGYLSRKKKVKAIRGLKLTLANFVCSLLLPSSAFVAMATQFHRLKMGKNRNGQFCHYLFLNIKNKCILSPIVF